MGRNEIQLYAGHLPEKAKPDKEPPVPAKKYKLYDGDAYKHVPIAGKRQVPAPPWLRVPGCSLNPDPIVPEPQAKYVDKNKESDLGGDGITQPNGGLDRLVKAWQVLG